jgi:hypothetical protein
MAKMAPAPLVAALIALTVVLGTGTLVAVRALGAWRSFRSFSRSTTAAVEGVTRAAAEVEARAVAAVTGTDRLASAAARLRESQAGLAVIQSAAGEFSAALARVRGAMPRK